MGLACTGLVLGPYMTIPWGLFFNFLHCIVSSLSRASCKHKISIFWEAAASETAPDLHLKVRTLSVAIRNVSEDLQSCFPLLGVGMSACSAMMFREKVIASLLAPLAFL